jgi:hypothetical protein
MRYFSGMKNPVGTGFIQATHGNIDSVVNACLLEAKWSQLRQRMPGLIERFLKNEEFYPVFVQDAQYIRMNAPPELLTWVNIEIAKLLGEFGAANGWR